MTKSRQNQNHCIKKHMWTMLRPSQSQEGWFWMIFLHHHHQKHHIIVKRIVFSWNIFTYLCQCALTVTYSWFKHVEKWDTFFSDVFITADLQRDIQNNKHRDRSLNVKQSRARHNKQKAVTVFSGYWSHVPLEDSRRQHSAGPKHSVAANVESLRTVAEDHDPAARLLLHDGHGGALVQFIITRT